MVSMLLLGAACDGPADPPAAVTGPRLRVLGTVQDGGLPHAGCSCVRCEAARHDPARRRRIASVAVLLPERGESYLIDATPDIREQLHALRDVGQHPTGRADRAPVSGVLLTHAHLGHYTGLAFFGFEALHTRQLPVWCTPRMAAYLRANGPWSQLVQLENVRLVEAPPGESFVLGETVTVTPLAVPHRDEYSDTVGFVLRGPRSSVLYVPDTDAWSRWSRPLVEVAREVDVAILDGTFYSADELPGRDPATIPHPLIPDTMERLGALVEAGRLRVFLTHLNHSNAALDPAAPERAAMEQRGFFVLAEGQELPL